MKPSPLPWLFARPLRCALLALALCPLQLRAQVTPSEPKIFEWIDPHPQFKIANTDKYVEYKRDGKVVYRVIERTTRITMPAHPEDRAEPVVTHSIEFIADGKVFASAALRKGDVPSWTLNSAAAVHFSSVASPPASISSVTSAPTSDSRSFWVCVPKFDYFEYVDVSDSEVRPHPETDASYAAQKRSHIKTTEEGSIKTPY